MKAIINILIGFIVSMSYAQNQSIKGIVYDAQTGKSLSGVSIQVKNSNEQTISDVNGKFTITVSKNQILLFLHPDYISIEVPAAEAQKIMLYPKNISLDELVIKTNPLEDITHSIIVMDEVKNSSQPRNVADLFKDIPGFSIQKRSASAMEPSLRSFKYEQMNIKFNGGSKIVNACPNRMDPATAHLIPESVRKIEVVKGPFTVRFGQTFGGIVNLITRQPSPEVYGWHGTIQLGNETNGNNVVIRSEITYAEKKYDISIDGEHRDFGDYTDGKSQVVPSGFKTDSYSIKLGYNPDSTQRIQINWHQKFGSNIKHAGLMMDSPKDDSYILSLDYKKKKLSDRIKYISLKTYYSYVDHLMTNGYGMDVPRSNYPGIDARSPVYSETMGGKFELALKFKNHWLVYTGMDADMIHRDGTKTVVTNNNPATGVPLDPVIVKKMKIWQDSYINDFGIFVQAKKKLSEHLFVDAGLRSDYVMSENEDPATGFIQIYGPAQQKTDWVVGGNVALKYLKDDLSTQLAFGRGTRTPSMIERYIYRFIVGNDSREYIGNPNLKPEINNQVEYSIQKKWDKLEVSTSVFYSYFQNYITPVLTPSLTSTVGSCGMPPKPPKVFRNVDAYQYGFDIFTSYNLTEYLTLLADMSVTKAYNLSLDEPLSQVAPPNAHLEIKYEKEKYWVDVRLNFVSVQKEYAPSFLETETPGYNTVDFRVGWRPFAGLSVGGAVLNLTDEAYYNHLNFAFINADDLNGQRIYEPGRSFSLYMKYKF